MGAMTRNQIIEKIQTRLKVVNRTKYGAKRVQSSLAELYNIPASFSQPIATLQKDLKELDDVTMYRLVSVLFKDQITNFYTEKEISVYSAADKFQKENIEWPRSFVVIRIQEDQYVGELMISELLDLFDAKRIRYNKKTQRPSDTEEIEFKPSHAAKIQEAYHNENFISNMFTLNVPMYLSGSENFAEFSGDLVGELTITAPYLDIIDGYHRTVAAQWERAENPDFDFPIIVLLTKFREKKALHFVRQQALGLNLTRHKLEQINMDSLGNKVIEEMLKRDDAIFESLVKKTTGVIDRTQLSILISNLYANRNKKSFSYLGISEELLDSFGLLIRKNPGLADSKWETKYLCCVMVSFANGNTDADDIEKFYREIISNKSYKKILYENNISNEAVKRFISVYDELFS